MPPANRTAPKRAKSSQSLYSLHEFVQEFGNDEQCLEWLWRQRFSPDGEYADCPKCEKRRGFKRYMKTKQQRQCWTCTGCGHHIHPTAGTIFAKSSRPLSDWFYVMYLVSSSRCGIAAKQIERELGCNYRTACRMLNKVRNELMKQDDEPWRARSKSTRRSSAADSAMPIVARQPPNDRACARTRGKSGRSFSERSSAAGGFAPRSYRTVRPRR